MQRETGENSDSWFGYWRSIRFKKSKIWKHSIFILKCLTPLHLTNFNEGQSMIVYDGTLVKFFANQNEMLYHGTFNKFKCGFTIEVRRMDANFNYTVGRVIQDGMSPFRSYCTIFWKIDLRIQMQELILKRI
jgi:hypothetical protein